MILNATQISSVPIFIGLTNADLDKIATEAHFDMRHYKKGSVIVSEYEKCESLLFITRGWVETDTYSDSRSYHIKELAQGPHMRGKEIKYFGKHIEKRITPAHAGKSQL